MILNGLITDSFLGLYQGQLFLCNVTVATASGSFSAGNRGLDDVKYENGNPVGRVGTAYGSDLLIRILRIANVIKWESLKGAYIRIDVDENNKVTRIGNILEELWLDFDAHALEWFPDRKKEETYDGDTF